MLPPDADTRHASALQWAQDIRSRFKTVVLGTVSVDGTPDASVAGAVVGDDGVFHVYVSQLAAHTRNLTATGRASLLVLEDEATSPQPLARRRLTFPCTATPVPRDTAAHAATLAALRAKLGPAFDLITGLGDFRLIRLQPTSGRLVAGFGQAFDVDPRDWTPRSGPLGPGRGDPAVPR